MALPATKKNGEKKWLETNYSPTANGRCAAPHGFTNAPPQLPQAMTIVTNIFFFLPSQISSYFYRIFIPSKFVFYSISDARRYSSKKKKNPDVCVDEAEGGVGACQVLPSSGCVQNCIQLFFEWVFLDNVGSIWIVTEQMTDNSRVSI